MIYIHLGNGIINVGECSVKEATLSEIMGIETVQVSQALEVTHSNELAISPVEKKSIGN